MKELQAELISASTPAAKRTVKKKIDDIHADAIRHQMKMHKHAATHRGHDMKIPAAKIKEELNSAITDELDSTLHRFHKMSQDHPISASVKAQIKHYMRMISANLLRTYLTYDEWTDKSAVLKESSAIKAGDASAASHIRVGHPMGSKHIVEQFIADTWRHPTMQKLPESLGTFSLKELTTRGVSLPSGAHVTITTKAPNTA